VCSQKGKILLILYVDNAIIISPDQEISKQVAQSLGQGFPSTDVGPILDWLAI